MVIQMVQVVQKADDEGPIAEAAEKYATIGRKLVGNRKRRLVTSPLDEDNDLVSFYFKSVHFSSRKCASFLSLDSKQKCNFRI